MYVTVICSFLHRCSSGNTESFKDKHLSRNRKSHVTLTAANPDDKSSTESLNIGIKLLMFYSVFKYNCCH